jgi:uncharacterized protein DUF4267
VVDRATATVLDMNPVIGLSLGRIAVGAAAVANPELASRTFRLDPVTNPQVPYMTRLFGSREIALGVATLVTRGKAQRSLIGIGVLVDAADAATGYLAMQDGTVSKKTAMTLIGPAVGATVSGLVGLLRRG